MNILITVTTKKDNLFLGYERINSNGQWTFQISGRNEWLQGIINAKEPVNRTVEELS